MTSQRQKVEMSCPDICLQVKTTNHKSVDIFLYYMANVRGQMSNVSCK